MKKIYAIMCLVALLPLNVRAQDSRMRSTSTIVADALASLPASDKGQYDELMQEIASTGADGIVELCGMLAPAEQGENALVEYALYGVANYVASAEDTALKESIRLGLVAALDNCTDNPNKAFLMTLLQTCASRDNAAVFLKYITDPYLSDWAANGLITTPDAEKLMMELMEQGAVSRIVFANAAERMRLGEAEATMLEWLKDADAETAAAIHRALARCGTSASLKRMDADAKAVDYGTDATLATDSYLTLLGTLVENGELKPADIAARKLLKSTERSNVKSAALHVIFAVNGKNARKYLLSAMNDTDREYRVDALRAAEAFADDDIYASLGKLLAPKGEREVTEDILNWFGTNRVISQIGSVVSCIDSQDDGIAQSAIRAAGNIGGEEAIGALVAQLKGKNSPAAMDALLSFNGSVNTAVAQALNADRETRLCALRLIAKRRIKEASDDVFALLSSDDAQICMAAYEALPSVSLPADLERLCALLENASDTQVPKIQNAIQNSIATLTKEEQYSAILPYAAKSRNVSLYYPLLAVVGGEEAIAAIMDGYEGPYREEAFRALLIVDDVRMTDILFDIASADNAHANAAWLRYDQLVSHSDYNSVRKYQLYRKALEAADDETVRNAFINSLAETYTYQALMCVEPYIDNPATAERAAYAVRNIVSKNTENYGGVPVKEALEKAKTYLSTLNDADAGYAVDDINGMLGKLPSAAYEPAFGDARLRKLSPDDSTVQTDRDYENFELTLEWKGKGEIGVRSLQAIQLGGDRSGALLADADDRQAPKILADNEDGEWNTLYVKVVNDRVTVSVNGVTTANNLTLRNGIDGAKPIPTAGRIMLIGGGEPVEFREVYVRELPATPRFELSAEEAAEGFEVLFDGTSMHLWTGNTTNYIPVDGTIYVTAQYGGTGNLYTIKEYSDLILRFEFRYVKEGVNNGIGIRTPMGVDAAYHGMEIQILDHDAPIYKGLREYQQHGSVYGIIPAKRVKFPALGEWNTEEIRAEGNHIVVTVNGEVILDDDIYEACQGHNVSEDGSDNNPYTVDHLNHPGLFNKSGHVGFLGHGEGIMFRNIRIKDLSRK